MSSKKLIRLANTLRHLRLNQLYFYALRRGLPAASVSYSGEPGLSLSAELIPPVSSPTVFSEGDCTFLNCRREFDLQHPDWCPADTNRLWRYNLHYFDYLRQPDLSPVEKDALIASWVEANPQPSQPGWEPFTVSLRIVNWVFHYTAVRQAGKSVSATCLSSLYEQALWLEKNDERHILANHYFENLKALAFAGMFFEGADAKRWRERAVRELTDQLREQNLADGGHYERTPQYHALMLENYLDLLNLVTSNPGVLNLALEDMLREVALTGLDFLRGILFPDGKLPLFNDSAFNIAPDLTELVEYAERLSLPTGAARAPSLINYDASGLYGYRFGGDMLIVDCGEIGPRYQPGHTHCDFLSYELMLAGQRVVVDTGVCEYEPGEIRHYLRSTRAHNTMVVDGDEQSEIWGEFRVARRARKLSATARMGDGQWYFEGAFKGFYGVRGRIVHSRSIQLELDNDGSILGIQVDDSIEGAGEHRVESLVHFHPDIEARQRGSRVDLFQDGTRVGEIVPDSNCAVSLEKSIYCPEFGLKINNQCLVLSRTVVLPCKMEYTISRAI